MVSFANLPADIYACICSFLEPLSILTLGQICSSIRGSIQERYIWILALKHASLESQIFAQTFDFARMSLSELMHASTAPQRILRKLHGGDPIVLSATSVSQLIPQSHFNIRASDLDLDSGESDDRIFRRLCIIPGGRLLIAFSFDELIIYDLESYKPTQKIGDVLRIPYDFNFGFLPCPSPDGKELRLLSAKRNRGTKTGTIYVFSITYDENHDSPPTVDCRTLELSREKRSIGQNAYTMVGNLVLFIYRSYHPAERYIIAVWNYMEDTLASWVIPLAHYDEVFMHDNYVCTVTEESIQLWLLPNMIPRDDARAWDVMDVDMGFQIPLAPTGIQMGSCAKLTDWYNSYESPKSFDYLATRPFYHSFIKYSLPLERLNRLSTTDEPLPFVSSDLFREADADPDDIDSFNASSYALCHGRVVKPFMNASSGRIYLATAIPPESSDQPDEQTMDQDVVVELLLPESCPHYIPSDQLRVKKWDFAFDPMSGRLAYLSSDFQTITVVNYLKYPWADSTSSN